MTSALRSSGSTSAWRRIRAARLSPLCEQCGRAPTPGHPLELDHIVPRHQGGTDEPANLRTLCHDCHARRARPILTMTGRARRDRPAIPTSSRAW